MAKRRMISQGILVDEDFNTLSLEAQNIFLRMLAVSDDYGVVPVSEYTLDKLINTPSRIRLADALNEITVASLGRRFEYQGKPYFLFKRERFDDYQSYLVAKRTKSEYLRLSKEFIESERFQEILGNSPDCGAASIESIKQKVEGRKSSSPSAAPIINRDSWEFKVVRRFYYSVKRQYPSLVTQSFEDVVWPWTETLQQLQRLDGYSRDQIIKVLGFVRTDKFWSEQIRSLPKLRKKDPQQTPYFNLMLQKAELAGRKNGKETQAQLVDSVETDPDFKKWSDGI